MLGCLLFTKPNGLKRNRENYFFLLYSEINDKHLRTMTQFLISLIVMMFLSTLWESKPSDKWNYNSLIRRCIWKHNNVVSWLKFIDLFLFFKKWPRSHYICGFAVVAELFLFCCDVKIQKHIFEVILVRWQSHACKRTKIILYFWVVKIARCETTLSYFVYELLTTLHVCD